MQADLVTLKFQSHGVTPLLSTFYDEEDAVLTADVQSTPPTDTSICATWLLQHSLL